MPGSVKCERLQSWPLGGWEPGRTNQSFTVHETVLERCRSSSPHHTTTLENILDSHNKSEMRGLGGLLYYLICQAKFPTSYTVTFYANVFNI